MRDDLAGLEELHELLLPPDLGGLPEFHALVEADVAWSHGRANVMNGFSVFMETLEFKPRVPSEASIVGAILEAEQAAGVEWPAA